MTRVRAKEPGYYGGIRRDAGARFSIPDEVWKDPKRRPKWVKLDTPGAIEGEPEATKADAGEKPAPAKPGKGRKGRLQVVDAPTAEPFAEAPEPSTVRGNGVTEALGATPDWLPPGAAVKADD